jgi:hypothetical protein
VRHGLRLPVALPRRKGTAAGIRGTERIRFPTSPWRGEVGAPKVRREGVNGLAI